MTKEIKTIIALVVLIAIVIIGWLWYGASSSGMDASVTQKQSDSPEQQVYVSADASLDTSPSDTSDAALQSDLGSVNAQMKSLDTDTSSISN